MSRPLIPALLLFFFSGSVHAYPIFYACTAGGGIRDYLDSKDIREKVLSSLKDPATDSQIQEICQGDTECFAVLKQALLLTKDSAAAASEVYEQEVRKIEAKVASFGAELDQEMKIDPSITATAKNLILMADSVNECRRSQMGASPEQLKSRDFSDQALTFADFRFNSHEEDGVDKFDLFIQHGVDNEYNFVSGIGKIDDSNRKTDYDHIGTVIRQAVAANLDPYAALATAYLEGGKPDPFMIDPMPALGLMGCMTEKIKSFSENDEKGISDEEASLRANGTPFIYNWGTFYKTKAGVSTGGVTAKVVTEMNEIQRVEGPDPAAFAGNEPGFACVQDEGSFLTDQGGTIVKSFASSPDVTALLSKSKACCMKIPYISQRAFSVLANIELGSKLQQGGAPENRLQKFNGTGVIGITEKAGVGAFRFGLNQSSNPQYGAQGMDFILNSFMINPMIRYLVDEAERDFGKDPPSLVCSGKSAGTYAIDSNKYVNMQTNMKRLTTMIGKSWDALTPKERAMFVLAYKKDKDGNFLKDDSGKLIPLPSEYRFVLSDEGKSHPNLSSAENAQFQNMIAQFKGMPDDAKKWDFYRAKIYPFRDTLGKSSLKSWSRFDDGEILEMRQKILEAPEQK